MKNKSLLFIAIAMLFVACEQAYIPHSEILAPILTDFNPKQGEVGTEITITGEHLQRVDTVMIGSTPAAIVYRISSQKLIAKVVSGNRSGIIRIANVTGASESKEEFTVNYSIPSVKQFPTEGTVNEEIVVEGDNLHFIDQVLVDDEPAVIIAQHKQELVFKVPYTDVEDSVSLRFTYFDGTTKQSIGAEGKSFLVLKEAPKVKVCPASLTKYEPALLQGENLKLIEKIMVGEEMVEIKLQSDDEILFDMPTNYFGGNMTGDLKGIYYGVKEVVIAKNFQVIADPNEPRYYTYKNVLLSARANYGGTEEAFFDAESGMVISSCDAASNISIIDFLLYDQAGYVQLYSPMNASNVVKNFKCEGKTIDPQDGTWKDFYTTETYFRVLNPDSAAQQAIINAYEAGTIVELDDAFFTGIAEPVSKAPRVYKSASDPGYSNTHFSLDAYPYGWVKNTTTGKSGIIKMTDMPKEAVNGRISELTFDIIWSK